MRVGKQDHRYIGDLGWNLFEFAIFKITHWPPEGCELRRENYKGFWIKFYFWLPIDIKHL